MKSFRKKTYGEPEPNRADQGAGFTLVASDLTGGDAAPLLQLAPLGREAEQEARELLALDRRLRQAYGVPTPP